MAAPPARTVANDVVEEILLRLPPHKPAYLVRASAVSKPWLALISSARFKGRYREFHGSPPMLGFLKSGPWDFLTHKFRMPVPDGVPPFVSTTKFRARVPDDGWGHKDYAESVWDCRHGRVLLAEKNVAPTKLAVWDPMTGYRREFQEPDCMAVKHEVGLLAGAVLCAVSGCNHHACHEGPFRVVFFSLHNDDAGDFVAQACVSLPDTDDRSKPGSDVHRGEWSQPCFGIPIDTIGFIEPKRPLLLKDAIHFILAYEYEEYDEYDEDIVGAHILKYDLISNCLSLIDAPSAAKIFGNSILMAMEDGCLGFAHIKKLRLYILSSQIASDGVATWTRTRVIDLKNIPPIINPHRSLQLIGSVEGSGIIFVRTEVGIYKINLKTLRRKKIWEGEHFHVLIPYMSFYIPRERVRLDVAR